MNNLLAAIDRFLSRLSAGRILTIAILGVAGVAIIDYLTGYLASFSLFYLAPVALSAWYAGARQSIIIAVLSCISWYVADIAAGHPYSHMAIPIWNALVRFGFFIITGLLVAALRKSLNQQQQLARTDALTGIFGRRAFEERLDHDLELSRRNQSCISLVFLDIDNFKKLNDTHGHGVGDAVLQQTAQALTRTTRTADTVARLGGDEFAVVLPNTDRAGAEEVISKLREDLKQVYALIAPGISCSIGIVSFEEAPFNSGEAMHMADLQMYDAKRSGKNRVTFKTVEKTSTVQVQQVQS